MERGYSKLVVLGGGTGIHPVIMAARLLMAHTSAIVAISDSGGSTGRLRKIFNHPAIGDLRQAISGMADPATKPLVAELLEYRFQKGDGLQGHTVGNLLLTALQEITGSLQSATDTCMQLLNIEGSVIPVSETQTDLQITYTDGTTVVGQHILNEHTTAPKKVAQISFTTPPVVSTQALSAIAEADVIVIGPGDYYDSILATLLVPGIVEALCKTTARIVTVVNLMSSQTRTDGMTASDQVRGIEKVLGRQVMNIICNSQIIPAEIKKAYAQENSFPVVDDLGDDQRVIRAPLLEENRVTQNPADVVSRSILRHSSTKLVDILKPLL